jgi:hypothetical protein
VLRGELRLARSCASLAAIAAGTPKPYGTTHDERKPGQIERKQIWARGVKRLRI